MVKPPMPVWVDLAAVYPQLQRHVVLSDALDLRATVPGSLHMWERTTTGEWAGWVSFNVASGNGSAPVSQWVLASALRPRGRRPKRASSHRGCDTK